MTHTEELLCLVSDFPGAFSDPEEDRHLPPESAQVLQARKQDSITDTKAQQLLQLINEFPIAFVDPEKPNEVEPENCLNADTSSTSQVLTASSPELKTEKPVLDPRGSVPTGYAHALRRRVQTLAWGQVDFHLIYAESNLEAIWAITGKSGTEVQSLCEAICRLINLLLSKNVPIPEIVREIRGIRGADSEGLGPNRILGLADLMGKVLQEAPAQFSSAQIAEFPVASSPVTETEHQTIDNRAANLSEIDQTLTPAPQPTVSEESVTRSRSQSVSAGESQTGEASLSQILFDTATATSTLCPECGAELQQVNGCKGGACIVCGHSSCS